MAIEDVRKVVASRIEALTDQQEKLISEELKGEGSTINQTLQIQEEINFLKDALVTIDQCIAE